MDLAGWNADWTEFGGDQRSGDCLGHCCSSREDVRELQLGQKWNKGVKMAVSDASGNERTGCSIGLNTEK